MSTEHSQSEFSKRDFQKREIKESIHNGRVIDIYGEIGWKSLDEWKEQLNSLAKSGSFPITLKIDSQGGLRPAVWFFDDELKILRREQGIHIYSLADKLCGSAAIDALLLGHPDGIYATPGTNIQFHGSHIKEDYQMRDYWPITILNSRNNEINWVEIATTDRKFSPEEAQAVKLIDGILF
jgi:hypothetical protein